MSSRMGKTQVVASIAEQCGVTKKTAAQMLDAFIELVMDEVKRGNAVAIQGFGTYEKSHRKKRMGVNPKTRERIEIPATNVPKFRPGSEFKELVK